MKNTNEKDDFMKKKMSIIFYSLFFIASIIMETYCLLQLRDDLISLGGMSLVVLISAYLLIDSILGEITKEKLSVNNNNFIIDRIEKKLEDMENIQKAIYVSTKKSYSLLEERLADMENNIEDKLSCILKEQKTFNDTIIKYASNNDNLLAVIERLLEGKNISNETNQSSNKNNSEDKNAKLASLDIDISDPNKKLSPDEIAVLFNKLG